MQCLAILATLVAAVMASPLSPRAVTTTVSGNCASLTTTTTKIGSATATLKGPFVLQATSTGKVNGNYAEGTSKQKFTFDRVLHPKLNATRYYLNPAGHIQMIDDGVLYTSYEYSPLSGNGGILFDTNPDSNIQCTIKTATCALACKAGPSLELAYNVLLSPAYKPDWYIAANASATEPNAIAFTPIVVAMPAVTTT